ncbi:hypothetical protein GCM10025762_45210 [Haloechinothrix salitolerans]
MLSVAKKIFLPFWRGIFDWAFRAIETHSMTGDNGNQCTQLTENEPIYLQERHSLARWSYQSRSNKIHWQSLVATHPYLSFARTDSSRTPIDLANIDSSRLVRSTMAR